MNRLRVLLVDDEIMIREGFRRLFDWQGHDCEVIGEAADGPQALNSIDTLLPDVPSFVVTFAPSIYNSTLFAVNELPLKYLSVPFTVIVAV